MPEKITLEQVLKLVSFMQVHKGGWMVMAVHGNVHGDVHGTVKGTINGRRWGFVETPQEKLDRLILKSGDQELIEAFNQLHQNI